jgi:hypothetical protein
VYVLVNRSNEAQSIDLSTAPTDTDVRLINWLDETQAVVRAASSTADGRPQIEAIPGATPAALIHSGHALVNLKPWAAMVLAPADAK